MPPHPFDKHWYAHVDGKTYGPYTGHEISRMVGQGQILESDFVFSDDQSAWVRAKDDPILSTLFQRPVTAGLSAPLQRYVTDKLGRRARIAVFTALFAVLVGWIAWPYYTLYALMNALREGDTAVIENSIAWDSVRQGLRGDLNAVLLHKLSTDAWQRPKRRTKKSSIYSSTKIRLLLRRPPNIQGRVETRGSQSSFDTTLQMEWRLEIDAHHFACGCLGACWRHGWLRRKHLY